MNRYDRVYESFNKILEQNKREKFNAFMQGFDYGMEKDKNKTEELLNRLYIENQTEYNDRIGMLKMFGYKVLRNSAGKHLIRKD